MRRFFLLLVSVPILLFVSVLSVAHAEEGTRYFIDRPEKPPLPLVLTAEEAAQFQGNAPHGFRLEKEGEFFATTLPDDPQYTNQTELTRIGAESVWSVEQGSRTVVVAVLDSGVDLDHPDLEDNIWVNQDEIAGNGKDDDGNGYIDDRYGWDFAGDSNNPDVQIDGSYVPGNDDGVQHGTIVSGVIGAVGNNGVGVAGVAWKVQIMPLRVLNSSGVGLTSSIIAALDYARENGADIASMSLVGASYSASLDITIQESAEAGMLMVAASGNEGINLDNTKRYPVCLRNVLGVASVNAADVRSSFSNYGSSCVDIAAPGEGIYTTQALLSEPGFSAAYGGGWAGTSLSTPFVAGAAALVKTAYPTWSVDLIAQRIKESVKALSTAGLGSGRLALDELLTTKATTANTDDIITAPGPGGGPDVRVMTMNGRKRKSILAYAPTYRNGVNVAVGDVMSGNNEEVITGTFAGGGPHVRIFNKQGAVKGQFFAYDEAFRGGVDVAAGDMDGDGTVEIITAPGPGGGPDVRIFTAAGYKRKSINAFDAGSRAGTHVAAGDLTGNGKAEIVAAQMAGTAPMVRIFSKNGEMLNEFLAYGENFRGGIDVAVGDIDGDAIAEIITAPGPGGGPHIRIFDIDGNVKGQFFAYAESFRNGVRVAAGDVDGDAQDEIVTGPMAGGGPHVRVMNGNGSVPGQFFVYAESFRGGLDVSAGRIY
ncbi:MAG: S8 family serine peptidase [Patescibacteria group bacterium]|jgi:hypothetical protein